eukprot:GHVP01055608.1.p1 GENE.GHVP01055608.1~~GHVP01055608.1.p1  ORF type:complete len:102 (-),score=12.94 GHVP01055608.1:1-276(-)
MDQNPIHPAWTGHEDPNIQFLEDHILRTLISSESNEAFSMPKISIEKPIPRRVEPQSPPSCTTQVAVFRVTTLRYPDGLGQVLKITLPVRV